MTTRTKFPHRRLLRKEREEKRLESWRLLSPSEQLRALDALLGRGKGARKQRERLEKLAAVG